MDKKTSLEWKSEKSRNLIEVLARESGRFLYEELPKIAGFRCNPGEKEDFVQDFFMEITGRAYSYKYNIDGSKSIHEDENLKAWVVCSYYNFRVAYHKKQERRIPKERGKPRVKEIKLDSITSRKPRLAESMHQGLKDEWYWICMERSEYPQQRIMNTEMEKRKKEVEKIVQEAINQLRENRREIIRMYYFGNSSTSEIGKNLGISQSNVTSQLFLARKDLLEILPYSIAEKRGWVEIREAA